MADFKRVVLSGQQVVLLFVCLAVVFFAFLNLEGVTVDLFFTQLETSVALLLLVPLLAGMLLGWVGGRLAGRRKRRGAPDETAEPPPGQDAMSQESWANLDLDELEI